MSTTRKAIVQALVEGTITELMIKTQSDNVYIDETTTLSAKLAEIIASLNEKAKSADVTTEINTAISGLIGGAPETYNTLKEISDYIATHQEVVDALNAAIGDKASQVDFAALKATVDGLGDLAKKSKVAETDLDDTLKAKINASSSANHTHDNKAVLDGITSELVTEWNSKGTVHVSATQPTDLAAGDLWIKTI